jgi:predicted  nucleic acid-binding Zn-ribbon protein
MSFSQASSLYKLQTLDLAIAQKRTRLEQIAAILGQDETVARAQAQLNAADQALTPWQTRSRNLDLEIKSLVQKIQLTEQSLYSGKITNPKELRDLGTEIESLKRRQSQLEDDLLDAMVHVEDGQASVETAKADLDKAQAAWAGSQTDLLAEKKRLDAEVADLVNQRSQMAEGIDRGALAKYEALRPKKRGQPVSLLRGDSCTLCGVEQTSQMSQQVRQGSDLVYCANCGRILAVGG